MTFTITNVITASIGSVESSSGENLIRNLFSDNLLLSLFEESHGNVIMYYSSLPLQCPCLGCAFLFLCRPMEVSSIPCWKTITHNPWHRSGEPLAMLCSGDICYQILFILQGITHQVKICSTCGTLTDCLLHFWFNRTVIEKVFISVWSTVSILLTRINNIGRSSSCAYNNTSRVNITKEQCRNLGNIQLKQFKNDTDMVWQM